MSADRSELSVPGWPSSERSNTRARLNQRHREDIRDIACGVIESCVGVCTRYLVDRTLQISPLDSEEAPLFEVERFVDRYGVFAHPDVVTWRRRLQRARKTLDRMASQSEDDRRRVAVLHIAYGPEDPATRYYPEAARERWGRELTGLVRYTEIVEAHRRVIIRRSAHNSVLSARDARSIVDGNLRGIVSDSVQKIREREEYFERVYSSGDAVRAALDLFSEAKPMRAPGEDSSAWKARMIAYEQRAVAHAEARLSFIEAVRDETYRMLIDASSRYHAVWTAVGPC